jgi:UDPglucose 6-dehydrogenase|tara:strand:- start:68 stop:916 length:849 start_codon:yes stop_codon:yes gene_type:complete
MKKIGIIGQGFVGTAVREGFQDYFTVLTNDKNGQCSNTLEEIIDRCRVIFLCLPTPMSDDGSCYLGIVEEVLEKINERCDLKEFYGNESRIVVIKSTMVPGTTEKFNKTYKYIQTVFNPEFLTEANSIEDFKNQNRIILGGPRPATTIVKRIFNKAFPKVPIIKTGSTTAEMVKYFLNSFLATKVSFANEMYQICEALDIDYDKVTEYAKYDDRIGKTHLNVPGPDGDFGYGGHCFPKDVKALKSLAHKLNVSPRILQAVDSKNNDIRQNRDWEDMPGRAVI